jgi:hypothetical protein
MTDFATGHYRRARKPQACLECGHVVVPGEHYYRLAGATNGHGWSEAFCLQCDRMREFAYDIVRSKHMHEEDGPRLLRHGVLEWLADYEQDALLIPMMPPAVAGHYAGLLFATKERA